MITALYVLLAVACIALTAWYYKLRTITTPAYEVLQAAKGEDIRPAASTYWSLTKRHQRVALGSIALYVAAIVSFSFTDGSVVRSILAGAGLVAFITMLIICEIHNWRETEIRITRGRW